MAKDSTVQLDAAHHLNRLSDTNEPVFNFIAKVLHENAEPSAVEIKAAAEWIDNAMRKRHTAGRASGVLGGRPLEEGASQHAIYMRAYRERKKQE
jgi:hypothetical protein